MKLDFYEPWLFTWPEGNKFLILVLYVDDILLASNDSVKLKEIKVNLKRNFDMTDIGEPKSILGLEIQRDRKHRTLKIHQENQVANRQRKEREETENISELITTEKQLQQTLS